MQNQKATNEDMELSKKLLDLMTCHSIKESELFVKFYENQLNYKSYCLAQLEDEEPPKFFKKSHAKWQQKIDDLNKEIEDTQKKLLEEYSDIGKCITFLKQ